MFTVQCNLHLIDICINVNSAIKYLSDKIVLLENNYMYLADLDNHDCEKKIYKQGIKNHSLSTCIMRWWNMVGHDQNQ